MRELFKEHRFDETPKFQMYKVLDELVEAEAELIKGDRDKFLIEMIDVMNSAANVLYKAGYSDKEIDAGVYTVYLKNKFRGYYDK
jgi:hypothetical protein